MYSRKGVSCRVALCPVVFFRVLSCCFVSCRVFSRPVALCRLLWFHVVSCLSSLTRYMFCLWSVLLRTLCWVFRVVSCPALSHVLSCLAVSCHVLSCLVMSRHFVSFSCLTPPCLQIAVSSIGVCVAGDGVRRCSEREEDSHVLLRPNRQSLGPRKRVLAIVLGKRVWSGRVGK